MVDRGDADGGAPEADPDKDHDVSGVGVKAADVEVEPSDRDDEASSELARERDEMRDALLRVQAEFDNFRKRTLRDQTARSERAAEGLVEELLPVMDNFELALVNIDDAPAMQSVRKGVELVFAELLGTLEKAGLERIDADGCGFDPAQHEAVMQIEGELEGEPVVAETVRTGYRLKGRVIRPAMVKVIRK